MDVSTFLDLQGYMVGKRFIVKEATILKNGTFLSHYSTFLDLQGYMVGKRFIVKEAAILKNETILSHYFFTSPMPWHLLTRSDKLRAYWFTANHHGLRWEDGAVKYCRAEHVITTVWWVICMASLKMSHLNLCM
ncbi:hypothetical protein EAI_09453 [Harpegnathos saltator]|uniref:Uncharacterized protein n=1 Tax=Harpegnathos saltator TaxID=610380 RepID=E2BR89_HARSA|nr:hypothetical protein EAI_09453 [Harpegnathos saltator]